ncbi:MAG TPA: hypothetical protein VK891_14330 [Euzebyales bacterium]|nr:hypothetical protein [Euzebyales bacterium]
MSTPDDLEARFTLLTAAARYDELRTRDALAPPTDGHPDEGRQATPLSKEEALELLALGEVIARKAGYGRQLTVRSARASGASWSEIGAALGTSKQSAWEAHGRWIDGQAEQRRRNDYEGMGDDDVAAARALAGTSEDD